MPVEFCPSNDDEHGAFPHRLVVLQEKLVYRNREWIVLPREVFVICATCDHWVNREMVECRCPQKCHDQARADLDP